MPPKQGNLGRPCAPSGSARVAPGSPRQPYLAKLRGRLELLSPWFLLPTSRQTSAARLALLHSVLLKPPNALWLLVWGPSCAGRTSSDLHDPHRRYKISSSSTTPRVSPSNRRHRFPLRPRDPRVPRPFLLLRHLRVRDSSPTTTCVLSSSRVARPILPGTAPARQTFPVENHFPTRLTVPKPTNVGAAGTLGCGAIIHNWRSKSSPRPLLRRSAYNPPRHATCLPRRRQLTLRRRTSWPSFRPPYL